MLPKLFIIGGITSKMANDLNSDFTLCYANDMANPAEWLSENGAGIGYVLTNGHDGVPNDLLAHLPDVKLISNYGVGYDAIDVATTAARNIVVTHTPEVLNEEVATTALLLMLSCYRELLSNEAHARSGAWAKNGNPPLTRSADNKVIGIVGLGRIGRAVARKLVPFQATIYYHNRSQSDLPYQYYSDLQAMAKDSDVLIVTAPGGASTNKIINRDIMEALGPDGVLINVARGSVVDEAALIEALSSGALGWAGLDVFEKEPYIPEALAALPNVVLTPHIGSGTHETRQAMGQLVVDNLIEHKNSGAVFSPVPESAAIATKIARA